MTNGGTIFASFINGMIGGAIGGWAADGSRHPMIKGALVTGMISSAFTAVLLAGYDAGKSGGQVSGPPAHRQMYARFL